MRSPWNKTLSKCTTSKNRASLLKADFYYYGKTQLPEETVQKDFFLTIFCALVGNTHPFNTYSMKMRSDNYYKDFRGLLGNRYADRKGMWFLPDF